MKAEIDNTGELKITAENNIESFALKQWSDEYFNKPRGQCKFNLLIVWVQPELEP